jgi:predicted NAD/FAD-binding protein
MRIAVIGSGVSGLVAARLLASRHDVTLFEGSTRPGGHAHTLDVEAYGRTRAVDVAFMVFNHRTYPLFTRLLEFLGVPSRASDISFSVRCDRTGLEYQGSSLNGVFAQRRNLLRPRFHRMLLDIARFNCDALDSTRRPHVIRGTLGEFIADGGYRADFRDYYLAPLGSAIWSAPPRQLLEFPAHFFLKFCQNHGLLHWRDRPRWRTIEGGSRRYVAALIAAPRLSVRLGCPIESVRRRPASVMVKPVGAAAEPFEAVVMATHADQALCLLSDASPLEASILADFPYQSNEAVLHTDAALLPRRKRAWASWNYHVTGDPDRPAAVTYDLNRLQGLGLPGPLCLTLNPSTRIAADRVLGRFTFRHPRFTTASIASQSRWAQINGVNRTYFCGAYWRNGFHEDGVVSALAVAQQFGISLEPCTVAFTREPRGIVAGDRSRTASASACT